MIHRMSAEDVILRFAYSNSNEGCVISLMNIHIITSSYPGKPDDPGGTAGLFVRQFALELAALGHTVIVQPAARKPVYLSDSSITIIPAPWKGGDQELASMNLLNPKNWFIIACYVLQGVSNTLRINRTYGIDRTLCMWALPCGIFGLAGKWKNGIPYDVWALGSDIWKIGRIPALGKAILRVVLRRADRVFADGAYLCTEVADLAGVPADSLLRAGRCRPRMKVCFRETNQS